MNKFFKIVATLFISVVMVCMCMGFSYASSSIDYSSLFSKAMTTDGAFADQLSIDLGKAFNQDPKAFISSLSTQTDEQITKVVGLLAYDAFNNLNEFESKINNLKGGKISDKEVKVLDSISSYISVLTKTNHGAVTRSPAKSR